MVCSIPQYLAVEEVDSHMSHMSVYAVHKNTLESIIHCMLKDERELTAMR